jgi:MSHA biogenesis protein MshQ
MDGSALTGGEGVIRVHLSITGVPSGVETVEITPFDGLSIYDVNGNAAPAGTSTGPITLSAPVWYDSAWGYRVKITIDHTKVAGDLTNFPWLVHIPSNAGIAAHARTDGYDLVFTGDDEITKLDHEVEKYVSATGEVVAWVEIPFLSSGVDTVVYLYYGNPSAVDQSNPAGVWDTSYRGVWHLHDDFLDSASSSNDGTNMGSSDTAGMIADGQSLDGLDDYISTTTSFNDPQEFTVEAWFKTSTAGGHKIFGFESDQTGQASAQWDRGIYIGTDGLLYFACWDDNLLQSDETVSPRTFTDNTWHHLAAARDDTANTLTLYADGILLATIANAKAETTTGYWRIGSYKNAGFTASADGYFQGEVDEVRYSDSVRSADWIATAYHNQLSASGSVGVGIEESKQVLVEGWELAPDNHYVDITFSEGVYTDTSLNPVSASDFAYEFFPTEGPPQTSALTV